MNLTRTSTTGADQERDLEGRRMNPTKMFFSAYRSYDSEYDLEMGKGELFIRMTFFILLQFANLPPFSQFLF